MKWLGEEEGFEAINSLGKAKEPFLFMVSFDKQKIFAQALSKLDEDIYYKLETQENTKRYTQISHFKNDFSFASSPISFAQYEASLAKVLTQIRQGNSYLLNLTFATPIKTSLSLHSIYHQAHAKFKLYFKGKFVCFSPERFVEISHNSIATYPMKGTIDAQEKNAQEKILNNPKEMAEHIMIVDLMRNDLGIVGSDVRVEAFRYIDKIQAGEKELLQVSSKIIASLEQNWQENIGTILAKLLPAGSISGTPKKSTLAIIKTIENYERGFYTGIFGIYNGTTLNSAVMIRFIEKQDEKLIYKSGGGITLDSQAKAEYQELLDKIYLPI